MRARAYLLIVGILVVTFLDGFLVALTDHWWTYLVGVPLGLCWFFLLRWFDAAVAAVFWSGAVHGARGGGSDVEPWEVIDEKEGVPA